MAFKKKQLHTEAVYLGQTLHIRPHYIVSLPSYWRESYSRSQLQLQNEANLLNRNNNGDLSAKAAKKIRTAINWLLVSAKEKSVYHKAKDSWFKFKVNFITLTLPDTPAPINNKDFKHLLLEPWLNLMRNYYGLSSYVWKMEFQENGKLHCHITTDTFLHYDVIRTTWNRLILKAGYMRQFAEANGHCNPNSTDVHSVKKVKNLAAYVCKYMSKGTGAEGPFNGRIWGCSFNISRAFKTQLFICRTEAGQDMRCLFSKAIEWRDLTLPDKYTQEPRKWGEIFYTTFNNWRQDIHGPIKQSFHEAILQIQSVLRFAASPQLAVV